MSLPHCSLSAPLHFNGSRRKHSASLSQAPTTASGKIPVILVMSACGYAADTAVALVGRDEEVLVGSSPLEIAGLASKDGADRNRRSGRDGANGTNGTDEELVRISGRAAPKAFGVKSPTLRAEAKGKDGVHH